MSKLIILFFLTTLVSTVMGHSMESRESSSSNQLIPYYNQLASIRITAQFILNDYSIKSDPKTCYIWAKPNRRILSIKENLNLDFDEKKNLPKCYKFLTKIVKEKEDSSTIDKSNFKCPEFSGSNDKCTHDDYLYTISEAEKTLIKLKKERSKVDTLLSLIKAIEKKTSHTTEVQASQQNTGNSNTGSICPEVINPVVCKNGSKYNNSCLAERANQSNCQTPNDDCPLVYNPVCSTAPNKKYHNSCYASMEGVSGYGSCADDFVPSLENNAQAAERGAQREIDDANANSAANPFTVNEGDEGHPPTRDKSGITKDNGWPKTFVSEVECSSPPEQYRVTMTFSNLDEQRKWGEISRETCTSRGHTFKGSATEAELSTYYSDESPGTKVRISDYPPKHSGLPHTYKIDVSCVTSLSITGTPNTAQHFNHIWIKDKKDSNSRSELKALCASKGLVYRGATFDRIRNK